MNIDEFKPTFQNNNISENQNTSGLSSSQHKLQHAELIKSGLDKLFKSLDQYLGPQEQQNIRQAYVFADRAHLGQFRHSGEPYITHPISVATLCAEWKLDEQSIMAALMHDVLEDTGIDKTTMANQFGIQVANLVDGLSKIDKLHFESKEEQQSESFRKMLLAMAEDVRVILIKLADRMHNLQTMEVMAPDKRRRIAKETTDIYAPIANRLGLEDIYRQLQDMCLAQTNPWRYKVLSHHLKAMRDKRRDVFGRILNHLKSNFDTAVLPVEILTREKNIASIYAKMKSKKQSLSEVLDVFGFRLLVQNRQECYLSLGIVHASFQIVPGRFKDYIALPKSNGYQSLHTTVLSSLGAPVEIQIRTFEMDRTAHSGISSHWLYKDKETSFTEIQSQSHQTLQSLLHIQQRTNDSIEFLEHIKVDLSPDAVFVFTPKSKIKSFPRGATILDFAYSIHSDVGNHSVSALVNGVDQPLHTPLNNGDQIQVITNKDAVPSPSWLALVKTGKARTELRHYFRSQRINESTQLGKQLLEQNFKYLNLHFPSDKEDHVWEKIAQISGSKSALDLLADIGLGIRHAKVVAQQYFLETHGQNQNQIQNDFLRTSAQALVHQDLEKLVISGNEANAVSLSTCCYPIRGDRIIGYMQRKQGLIVHISTCQNAQNFKKTDHHKWIELEWDPLDQEIRNYPVKIQVIALNGKGLLAKISSKIAEAGANISSVTLETVHNQVEMDALIEVEDRAHLAHVFKLLRTLKEVKKISRPSSYAANFRHKS